MSSYKNIDDLFKTEVSDLKIAPSEEAWGNLESAFINAQRLRRRKIAFWSASAILALLSAALLWIYMPTHSITKLNQESLPISTRLDAQNGADDNTLEAKSNTSDQQIETQNQARINETKQALLTDTRPSNVEANAIDNPESKRAAKRVIAQGEVADPNQFYKAEITESEVDRIAISLLRMEHRSIYNIAYNYQNELLASDEIIDVTTYMERKRQSHIYTGLGASASMMYYPSTLDQFTYSFDMVLGYRIKNFYIESGVEYQFVKEEGEYRIDFRSLDSIGYYNKVLSFAVDPGSANTITYNTKEVTVFDSIAHYTHASPVFNYEYLNIPLKLGYIFWSKADFKAGVEAGVVFSKLLKSDIPTLVPLSPENGDIIEVSRMTPERVDLNFQGILSLKLAYKVTPSVSLVGQVAFRKYLNSIYESKTGVSQVKPYTMGLRFGIVYDF